METARILIAGKEETERNIIAEVLTAYSGFVVTGCTGNGAEALRMIMEQKPDVLICDLFLPEYDSLAILDQLRCMGLAKLPKVIIISSIMLESVIQKAYQKGADEYMIKPVNYEILIRRICDMMGLAVRQEPESSKPEDMKLTGPERTLQMISNLLIRIGLPAHLLGFRFTQEAVLMLVENPMLMKNRTKIMYPAIASKHSTSPFCVERAIRHVITLTWERGIAERYERELSQTTKLHLPVDKPTSGEFIALIAEYIRPRHRMQPQGTPPDHPIRR